MIDFDLVDRVGFVTFNRPADSNAFTVSMTRRLLDILREANGTADILTIQAIGPDFTIGRDRSERTSRTHYETFKLLSDLNKAIATFPGLTIVGARGRVYGFAIGLIMRADLAIVSDDARFVLDEVKHGFPPTFIMEEILQHLPVKRAVELILSGRAWDAKEALDIGLVSRVVPQGGLDGAVKEFVADLKNCNRRAILTCKRYIHDVASMPREARSAYAFQETMRFFTEPE